MRWFRDIQGKRSEPSARGVLDAVESSANCIKCGECETKCPYPLLIREMIEENLEFHERMAALV